MDISLMNQFFVFGSAPIALVGLFLIVFSIIVLSRIKESEVFTYFKLENVFTLVDCLIAITFPIYKCKNCFGDAIDPSSQCIIDLVLYYFLSPVVEMTSLFLSILAALLYLSSFSTNKSEPKYAFIFKLGPNVLAIIAFVLSCINFGYLFFTIEIGTYTMSNDSFNYECLYNDFGNSYEASAVTTVVYSLSYGFMILILVGINTTIVLKLRHSVGDRIVFTRETNMKRRHIGKRLTKIIVADCLNLTAARFPYLVWFIIESYSDQFYYDYAYVVSIFSVIAYLTVILKFFLFYSLNHRFNRECKNFFKNANSKIPSSLHFPSSVNPDQGTTVYLR